MAPTEDEHRERHMAENRRRTAFIVAAMTIAQNPTYSPSGAIKVAKEFVAEAEKAGLLTEDRAF